MNIVCNMCNRPINQLEILQSQQEYQRNIRKATDYIQTNNNEAAKQILRPLLNQYPKKVEIYQLMLLCLTENGKNLLVNTPAAVLDECAGYWTVLQSLPGGIDSKLRLYEAKRVAAMMDKLKEIKTKITILCVFIIIFAIGGEIAGGINWFVAAWCILIVILLKSNWMKHWITLGKSMRADSKNPFDIRF